MIGQTPEAEDFILKDEALFQSKKHIHILFKRFLNLVEDLRIDHENNFKKLHNGLPKEYSDLLDMADYFDHTQFQNIRKRVLDYGGEAMRNLESDIKKI